MCMASPSTSSKILGTESLKASGTSSTNIGQPQAPTQHSRALNGPVAILWDIENCPVPSDVRPEDVSGNIRMALRVHPVIKGAVTTFSAYGDFNAFPRRLREGCQRTGVKLIDVPNGRKDAADKAILVDMFLFALDHAPPSSILLISGDVDFAPALHILGQRGYTIILVIPSGVGVSSALSNAGGFVWDWPSVARGEGFVPPKASMTCGLDITGNFKGCHISNNPDTQTEEESIVYKRLSQSECSAQGCCFNSYVTMDLPRPSHSSEHGNSTLTMSGIPSGLSEVAVGPVVSDCNEVQDPISWVQPGDIQGLKGQLVKLLELSGGSLPLLRVPPEYHKIFGRPLYLVEYGSCKLVNLLRKMVDTMTVEGKGNRKSLCLRSKPALNVQSGMVKKDKKGKVTQESVVGCINIICSSDEFSDDGKLIEKDEKNPETTVWPDSRLDKCLENFKQELQELLVSCSCKIQLGTFVALYEQRYKKTLDYRSFGVSELEALINKVRDVVVLHEEEGSKRKFLIASCLSGQSPVACLGMQ